MIPAAIERNYPKRPLESGWWHMSLFQRPASPQLFVLRLCLSAEACFTTPGRFVIGWPSDGLGFPPFVN